MFIGSTGRVFIEASELTGVTNDQCDARTSQLHSITIHWQDQIILLGARGICVLTTHSHYV